MHVRLFLPLCHLGPAQLNPSAASVKLNLYEPASSNRNTAYSRKKGRDRLYRTAKVVQQTQKGRRAAPFLFRLTLSSGRAVPAPVKAESAGEQLQCCVIFAAVAFF
jgi:hypothetical protein